MAYPTMEQQIKHIASQFLPDSSILSLSTINTGHINKTFRITTTDSGISKDYLLQNLNTEVFTSPGKVTHNIVQCAHFLQQKCPDYPFDILTPVNHGQSDQYLIFEDGLAWRMFDFINESKSLDQVKNPDEAAVIGEAFGVFLATINRDEVRNYKVTIPDFHNFTKRYEKFKKYLSEIKSVTDDKERYLISQIDRHAQTYVELETVDFPLRIVHHDTKTNNVMLDEKSGKAKCVIDLDTLMPGHLFSDFGDLIRTVLNPYKEDTFPENGNLVGEDIIKSLFDGFLIPLGQLLTNKEKEYLIRGGKKITLLQVLRFLEDHLKGDKYYQVDYAGHNLDRALSQMYLYQSLDNMSYSLPH